MMTCSLSSGGFKAKENSEAEFPQSGVRECVWHLRRNVVTTVLNYSPTKKSKYKENAYLYNKHFIKQHFWSFDSRFWEDI